MLSLSLSSVETWGALTVTWPWRMVTVSADSSGPMRFSLWYGSRCHGLNGEDECLDRAQVFAPGQDLLYACLTYLTYDEMLPFSLL